MGLILDRLVEQRKHKGLTQEKLAELANLSAPTIVRLENGRSDPKLNDLLQIAQVLNTSVSYLIGEDENTNFSQDTTQRVDQTSRLQASGRLIYEWGGNNRIDLPDTPENRTMYHDLVVSAMKTT